MWLPKKKEIKKTEGNGIVAVAIDNDKGSQQALKWATNHLLSKGETLVLIHVVKKASSSAYGGKRAAICDSNEKTASLHRQQLEQQNRDIFFTYHCYCTRKYMHCLDVLLEDTDIGKALTDYVAYAAIEKLVLGAPQHGFLRFKSSSIPSTVSKGAPDFCSVYVIPKGIHLSSVRKASRPAPYTSPLLEHIKKLSAESIDPSATPSKLTMNLRERYSFNPRSNGPPRPPFTKGGRGLNSKAYSGILESDNHISFISCEKPSTEKMFPTVCSFTDSGQTSQLSTQSIYLDSKVNDLSRSDDFSSSSQESGRTSCSRSSQNLDDEEAQMRRLKLQLKQKMDMYSAASREAFKANQKAMLPHHWKLTEEWKLDEVRLAEEAALSIAEKERARSEAAAKRIAELETQKRANEKIKALKEAEQARWVLDNLAQSDLKYRRYTIEEIEKATSFFSESLKIGEGGYGTVYRCYLDHTAVAVKVLRPDAAQGRSQFLREVDILGYIRHPNMVLLLGSCPEFGILVYEYMANGSLDDCLFQKGNTPALSWQLRFRIAAEIATGLFFLHQTKPEPIVHCDLKPGNILLGHNYVSKISDVGLARFVPAVDENVTQFHTTSTVGTFCYIDPEYQQTGMLDVKSDIYSLGIMLLQLITAKSPMGLAYIVEQSIENGSFTEMLDPAVLDWPVEEALCFAKLALQCAELRRKDRPDLCKKVLPELSRLRELAEEKMNYIL
ncbi:U-box domain-containing protein 52-like [Quercus suber]|uniref:U-box domain-containing protein 52-like n=1 Tax=Quercus suber TaxID=58331 RepID=UPI000CE1B723|nr:U-box domain-containing protein 52-like [Quercus suber]